MTTLVGGDGAAGGLRAGLLLLVALGIAGVALSLAYERHWLGAWQLAPWITLGLILVATVALTARPTPTTVWLARTVAVLAIASGAIGVWQHIDSNYTANTAPQEDSHGHSHSHSHGNEANSTGASLGDVMTGAVGHAPIPSAMAIAAVGLALGLATIGLGEGRRRGSAER